MSNAKYLDMTGLRERYSASKALIYKWIKADGFPLPYRLGRATRWLISDLEVWDQAHLAKQTALRG